MRLHFFLFLASVAILSSCHFGMGERVSGNGHVVKQDRSVSGFNKVQVSGSMNVKLRQEAGGKVTIETDENLMPFIEVFTEGNNLVVREKRGYNLNSSNDITVYASSPSFTEIHVSGSGDVMSENEINGNEPLETTISGSGNMKLKVNVPELRTRVSGSGSLGFSGEAKDFHLSISGSGNAYCFDLNSDNVNVSLSGSSDAEVTANRQLDIHVSGSGNVKYKGSPSVNQRVSGSGEVRKVN